MSTAPPTISPSKAPSSTTAPPTGFLAVPADRAKLVGTFLVFAAVLLFTLLPAFIVRHLRRRRGRKEEAQETARARLRRLIYMRVVSCFNCFAAGVFVSTGLMDVLPDAIEDIEKGLKESDLEVSFPLAPFFMLIGFFVMLTIEQAVMCCSDSHKHGPGHNHASGRASHLPSDEWRSNAANGGKTGGAVLTIDMGGDTQPLALKRRGGDEPDDEVEDDVDAEGGLSSGLSGSMEGVRFPSHAWESDHHHGVEVATAGSKGGNEGGNEEQMGHNHVSEVMMKSGSPVRTVFLVGAMSVHALFEGLALGLRKSSTQIYQLLGAICLHKSLIALGIGLSLGQTRSVKRWLVAVCSLIFAGMSPIGTIIGMVLTYAARSGGAEASLGKSFALMSGSLQGMACGTFLYVTFFEVLPREINEATRPRQRAMYLASLIAGFAVMCLFIWWAR